MASTFQAYLTARQQQRLNSDVVVVVANGHGHYHTYGEDLIVAGRVCNKRPILARQATLVLDEADLKRIKRAGFMVVIKAVS